MLRDVLGGGIPPEVKVWWAIDINYLSLTMIDLDGLTDGQHQLHPTTSCCSTLATYHMNY